MAENPLDYTTIGVRQPGLIGEILHTVAADTAIGSLLLSIPVGPVMAQRDKAEHILPALAACAKPMLLVLTGVGLHDLLQTRGRVPPARGASKRWSSTR